ncbi:MFS family permease [Variovorax sp. TBS-050B]|nr:MFS family permease [Variovorax sp. TBS-050B]
MQLWVARLFGTAAAQMLLVAIGWHMYELTGSAWDLGLVGLYQFVPALLLALLAGHVVDRHHRGRIVAACFAVQGAVALVLLFAVVRHGDSRGLLLGLSLVLGAVRAFQMPAQQALTPLLVPPTLLARAMAFSSAGMQGAIIGGPALGGLLFVAGMAVVYGASVLCFVVACALVLRLRYAYTPAAREPVTLATVFAGVDFIWKRKPVLGAVSLDLFAVLLGGAVALLPIYAKDILHTGPWGLGLLRSAPAVGALVMSIALTRRPIERRIGRTLLMAVGLFGLCMVVFGISRSFFVSLVALAVSGGADMVNVVIPPDAGAARNARRDARPRERGQLDLHRREQPARRVRVGRHRGTARAGRLGGGGRRGHDAGGARLVQAVPVARAARPHGGGPAGAAAGPLSQAARFRTAGTPRAPGARGRSAPRPRRAGSSLRPFPRRSGPAIR